MKVAEFYIEQPIDTRAIKYRWLPRIAQNVADEYDPDTEVEASEVWEFVENECERYITDVHDGLTVIAAYGWIDAVNGECDYEDSPRRLFEQDAYAFAVQALEDKGIEVID